MSTIDEAIESGKKLVEMHLKAAELQRKMNQGLAIMAVWPNAFKDGMTCVLKAARSPETDSEARRRQSRGENPPLRYAYLVRSDGVEFKITHDQYWKIKDINEAM